MDLGMVQQMDDEVDIAMNVEMDEGDGDIWVVFNESESKSHRIWLMVDEPLT